MPAYIDFQLVGDASEVYKMLDHLDTCFSSAGLEVFMAQRIAPFFRQRAELRFVGEGDDTTGPWAPLAASTVAIRQGMGFPGEHPINIRTGDLYDYITKGRGTIVHEGAGDTALHFPQAEAPSAKLSKKLIGAQMGTTKAPARPVLAVGETDLMFFITQFMYYIQEGPA